MVQMSVLQKQYHDELKKELRSTQISTASDGNKESVPEHVDAGEDSLPDLSQISKDADSMSKIVMPRKKQKLLKAMEVIVFDALIVPHDVIFLYPSRY